MPNCYPRIYYLLVTFRIPAAASLKDKRSVVQPILARARNLGFSAVELNLHDRIKESCLGFSGIHHDAARFTDSVNKLKRMFEENSELVVGRHQEDYLDAAVKPDGVRRQKNGL